MQSQWIERGKQVIMHTYNSFPIVLDRGKGMYVWDIEGKCYLDFVSGIAVNCLGYKNETYIENVTNQLQKLTHCSNLYWNTPGVELAEMLIGNSCFDKVFFCNSGAEGVEAALKLARKYGKKYHGEHCYQIITMKQSFHGRTLGAITATGQDKYQKGLAPLMPGICYAPYNDFEALEEMVTDQICAILLEPIQGEGGIRPADKQFLEQVRKLCTEKNILLMFDEVQCGIGRTGKLFAYEIYDVKPDVIALAKGLGGGFPIGAMMAVEKAAEVFVPGDHASTYGGNPLACTAGKEVLDQLLNNDILNNAEKQGAYLKQKLIELKEQFDVIVDVRGIGLMQGMELSIPTAPIIQKCMKEGLLLVGAGANVIRFVPPLIVGSHEIDAASSIIQKALGEV